jgi:hypothetical protein
VLMNYRKPEHDIGSVDGIVRQYLRQKSALGTGTVAKGPALGAKRRRR